MRKNGHFIITEKIMTTEDDTFNALLKSPFDVVLQEIWKTSYALDDSETEEIIVANGWTRETFFKVYTQLPDDAFYRIVGDD